MGRRGTLALTVPAVASAAAGLWWLYTAHAGFPLGLHSDEPKKILFALTQEDDFHHPILMIQAMRLMRILFGITTAEEMTAVGRSLSAAYTLIGVVWATLIYRRLLQPMWAVGAAAALAVTPLLAVHAHYVKEDAVFLAAVMSALWALVRFAENPGRGPWVLGITMGLALAAQYKALLLVGLAYTLPYLGAAPRTEAYFRGLRRATLLAVGVFVAICYPLLFGAATFGDGFSSQVAHAVGGHYVKIYAIPELFAYHLRRSLMPGLTPPLGALALGGTLLTAVSWRRLGLSWRIALVYLAVFYVSAELSPSKPPPDFMRYMMPAAPLAVATAFRLLQEAWTLRMRWAPALAALAVVIPLHRSVQLVRGLEEDTRYTAAQIVEDLEAQGAHVRVETYASIGGTEFNHDEVVGPSEMLERGVTHVALSSFAVDRYFEGERMAYQRPDVYGTARKMHELLSLPHVEVRAEPFAYSNPTIWIVDLREAKRLP